MSTWSRDEDRLLLLELVEAGTTTVRRSQETALRHLADLRWIRRTPRADEWTLEPSSLAHVEALLDREWPGWRDALGRLRAAGLPPTPTGWAELRDRERVARLGALPSMLHEKTVAAITGAHSKVGAARRRESASELTRVTTDHLVRLRPSPGLALVQGDAVLDATAWAGLNGGEVILTQRALLAGTSLGGVPPRAILFVENLGAYLDFAPPAGVLLVHVPGWDSTLARQLVGSMPVPLLHFGDLDPAGVRIVAHLRELFPSLQWWVPSFAPEYFDAHARPCDWPEFPSSVELPDPVRALATSGRWLEQEPLVLDRRGAEELADMIVRANRPGPPGSALDAREC